jgi:hypothetical protein
MVMQTRMSNPEPTEHTILISLLLPDSSGTDTEARLFHDKLFVIISLSDLSDL